jgi:arabinan endo-1,5-alpha-L-arabinosidase
MNYFRDRNQNTMHLFFKTVTKLMMQSNHQISCSFTIGLIFFISSSVQAFEINKVADPSINSLPNGQLILSGTSHRKKNINVPIITGNNIKELENSKLMDAMPKIPKWTLNSIWGAEIAKVGNNYLMYFVGLQKENNMRCIGIAKSSLPTGPFIGDDKPLICPKDKKGVIAPAFFRDDDGTQHLLYKINAGGGPKNPDTAIWIAPLDNTGTQISGKPVAILWSKKNWEHGNIESPTLIKNNGLYFLFYSGSFFNKNSYAIGYVVSKKINGPYTYPSENPILQSDGKYFAPGSQGITHDKCGNWLLVFHAYTDKNLSSPRNTYIKTLTFNQESVSIKDIPNSEICN